jgi:hypothetical protein
MASCAGGGNHTAHRSFSELEADNISWPFLGTFIVLRVNDKVEHYQVTPLEGNVVVIDPAVEAKVKRVKW